MEQGCSRVGTPLHPQREWRIVCVRWAQRARDNFAGLTGGDSMFKIQRVICVAVLLLSAGGASAQSNEFATGNMHFDAKDMDMNGDHMITREEMIQYAEKQWDM